MTTMTPAPTGQRGVGATAWKATMVVVGAALLLVIVWRLSDLVIMTFLAMLVAAGLAGPVRALSKRMNHTLAVLLSFLGLVGFVILLLVLVVPTLVSQMVAFVAALPALLDDLKVSLVSWLDGVFGSGQGQKIVDGMFPGGDGTPPEFGNLLGIAFGVFGIIGSVFIGGILALMMMLDGGGFAPWAAQFARPADRPFVVGRLYFAFDRLGGYIRGLLVSMSFEGVGVFLGALVLGIPYAAALGAITFLAAAIPYLGTLLMIVPAFIIGWSVSPFAAVAIVVWIIILEQLEGTIVTPLVQSHAVNVSPIAVMLGVIGGMSLLGIVGGLVAIPIIALADIAIRDFLFPAISGQPHNPEAVAAGEAILAGLKPADPPDANPAAPEPA
jgi:predicted PurR-regulated permease PerM